MKKKILAVAVILIVMIGICIGQRVDCSDFKTAEDYYQLSMEDAAVLTGQYMHRHGMFQIRGTNGYDTAIGKLLDDSEFNSRIESKALCYYIEAYQGANVDSTVKFTIRRIPEAIASKNIQEYVDKANGE